MTFSFRPYFAHFLRQHAADAPAEREGGYFVANISTREFTSQNVNVFEAVAAVVA